MPSSFPVVRRCQSAKLLEIEWTPRTSFNLKLQPKNSTFKIQGGGGLMVDGRLEAYTVFSMIDD
jgi:hypothetical protein